MTVLPPAMTDDQRQRRAPRRFLAVGAVAIAAAVATAVGLTATSSANHGAAAATPAIVVSDNACAPGWVAPRSGETVFEVENTSRDQIYGVDLVGANQLAVYGEIEMIAPGTEVPLNALLPPGTYSFVCESYDGATLRSTPEQVSGPAVYGAHPYIPATSDEIQQATLDYRGSLMVIMTRLERDTDRLVAAVEGGDLALARRLWLPAHLDYERLGAAYDTFGNFNNEINCRPLGLVGGVTSPRFVGFLRLEYGLWHGQPVSELRPVARLLDRDVHGLVRQFPLMLTPANDLSLRTHEILENALQFELTGETDEGSNTNLATAWANAQGTELALRALTPILSHTAPAVLASCSAGLVRMAAAFKAYEHPDGTWTPLQDLTLSQRQHLDGELGALLEQVSVIPDLLDLPIRPPADND